MLSGDVICNQPGECRKFEHFLTLIVHEMGIREYFMIRSLAFNEND